MRAKDEVCRLLLPREVSPGGFTPIGLTKIAWDLLPGVFERLGSERRSVSGSVPDCDYCHLKRTDSRCEFIRFCMPDRTTEVV